MKPAVFDYHAPAVLSDALALLDVGLAQDVGPPGDFVPVRLPSQPIADQFAGLPPGAVTAERAKIAIAGQTR